MTSPQGMDELFWGRDHEDVNDWVERLTMAAKVRDLTADKLFKIAKLNLQGRAKEWYRRLQPAPTDWVELWTLMVQKYGNIDADDIRMRMDTIKQEPKERVQKYFLTPRQVISEGQDTRRRAEEEVLGQTKARDPKALRGDDVHRHRRTGWSYNRSGESFG
jgi:hypothetical protein